MRDIIDNAIVMLTRAEKIVQLQQNNVIGGMQYEKEMCN